MRLFLLFLTAGLAFAEVEAVGAIRITVADLDRSVAFYTQVLDFEKVTAGAGQATLKLGEETIELVEAAGQPVPADSRSNDRWFQHVAIIVRDMDAAYARLREHRVRHISPGPQTLPDWNPNAGGIRAFYFRDPDQHALEILWFPPDKGAAKWHQASRRLFLGIDHTAIVVADTGASLRFYRDTLGLRVAGESENYGAEQERLNLVFGARLRITALRAPQGPGIELLEYLSPADGRPYPANAQPNDLVWWQTRLLHRGAPRLIRDPDGHALELAQPKGDN